MNSIHRQPLLIRSLVAALQNIAQPASRAKFLKAWIKMPVEFSASKAHAAIPSASFAELFPEFTAGEVAIPGESLTRHGWNVKLHEEIYLASAVRALKPRKVFEIGTFNGQTTLELARAAPEDAIIYTIDLPQEMFDRTQKPKSFKGDRVGEQYWGSTVAHKIKQIRADATTFDFTPFHQQIDFVFVDGAHDYAHGCIDSLNAQTMARPGGAIVWHDFEPYWSGLVHALCKSSQNLALRRLSGTSMAVLRV